MVTAQVDVYQGFFPNNTVKEGIYNDVSETIDAADPDLQAKMQELFAELRKLNREFWKLASEQDQRDFTKWEASQ